MHVNCIGHLVLTTRLNPLTGTAEILGPVQIALSEPGDPAVSLWQQQVHSRQTDGQTVDQSEINESEAA